MSKIFHEITHRTARPDPIEKYRTHGAGWNPGGYAHILGEYRKK